MPLEDPDQQHLRSAHGYIGLGMFEEANAELEEIDPFCRHLPEVLSVRVAIYHGLKKWDLMTVVAKKLVEWNPDEPGNFIDWAYATRRAESIHLAHAILTRAAELHPDNGTVQFNLACYEAADGQPRLGESTLEASHRDQREIQADGSGGSGLRTAMGIVGHGLSMTIIEIRPSKKFNGAWVTFEAPGVEPAFATPERHHPVNRTSIEASWAARRPTILAILQLGVGPAPLFQLGG